MTLRRYMDVITRTIFHLQARDRCGTDDQAETGPKSEPAPGRNQHRNHVHTDSMSFNEFLLSINFTSIGSRAKFSGINAYISLFAKPNRLPFWVLLTQIVLCALIPETLVRDPVEVKFIEKWNSLKLIESMCTCFRGRSRPGVGTDSVGPGFDLVIGSTSGSRLELGSGLIVTK